MTGQAKFSAAEYLQPAPVIAIQLRSGADPVDLGPFTGSFNRNRAFRVAPRANGETFSLQGCLRTPSGSPTCFCSPETYRLGAMR